MKRVARGIVFEGYDENARLLVLAKAIKYAVVGKPEGMRMVFQKPCYIEPVRLDETGADRGAKLLRPIGKARKLLSFRMMHPTVGYDNRYIGANPRLCLEEIDKRLTPEMRDSIAQSGAVFTVENNLGLIDFMQDPFATEIPVKVTVYQRKDGEKLPEDIVGQNVKLGGKEYTPAQIADVAKAERDRALSTVGKGK